MAKVGPCRTPERARLHRGAGEGYGLVNDARIEVFACGSRLPATRTEGADGRTAGGMKTYEFVFRDAGPKLAVSAADLQEQGQEDADRRSTTTADRVTTRTRPAAIASQIDAARAPGVHQRIRRAELLEAMDVAVAHHRLAVAARPALSQRD